MPPEMKEEEATSLLVGGLVEALSEDFINEHLGFVVYLARLAEAEGDY
jgi:hypothetical protein